MSAETIRRAANEMRRQHGPDHIRHEMWAAMAAWLDLTTETPAFDAFATGRAGSHVGKNIRAAYAVARAYLGDPA